MNPEFGVDLEQYNEGSVIKDPMVEAGKGLFAFDYIKKATDLPWLVGSAAQIVDLALHCTDKLASVALGSTVGVEPESINGPVVGTATPGSIGGGI